MRGIGWAVGAIAAAGSTGCFTQTVPPNPLTRNTLPATADSGFVLDSEGFQASGRKAAWKEAGHIYLLTERTRLGPVDETPFGIRPTDELITVCEVSQEEYQRQWHLINNYNLWILWPFADPGQLYDNPTWSTFSGHHLMLWFNEDGQNRYHLGRLGQSSNSAMIRDQVLRSWDMGVDNIENFFLSLRGPRVYLIRDGAKPVEAIAVERDSESRLLAELRHAKPQRRAAAACVLGEVGETAAAIDGLITALDVPENDARVRHYMVWALMQIVPRGFAFDDRARDRLLEMRHPEVAEHVRRELVKRYPEFGLKVAPSNR